MTTNYGLGDGLRSDYGDRITVTVHSIPSLQRVREEGESRIPELPRGRQVRDDGERGVGLSCPARVSYDAPDGGGPGCSKF